MTQQKDSVVTPERFDSGMSWDEYRSHIQRNTEKFDYNYRETRISAADAEALRALAVKDGGPRKVLILGEDWCPDVFRGLPVIVRIAEEAGMEVSIFPRDDNLDIMNEFLNNGEHQSIPTAVFYTSDHRYLAHWIERPAKANAELAQVPALFEGLDREKDREEMRRRYDEFQRGNTWAGWRDETVREIRDLLESVCA